jgi:hypothetical protein
MAGAPEGNKNSSKENRLWADTIRRAAIQSDGERLRKIAEALLDKAADGDVSAIKEMGDRIDGRAIQQTVVSGDPENPLEHNHTVGFEQSAVDLLKAIRSTDAG